jgi:PKD repeat protein
MISDSLSLSFLGIDTLNDVVPPVPPVASFVYNPHSGDFPLTVAFTGSATNGPILQWAWDFGDSTQDASQNPSHEYTLAGIYNVTLQARNSGGWGNIVAHDVEVTTPAPVNTDPKGYDYAVEMPGGGFFIV